MRILLVNYEYPPLGGGGGIAMMEFAQQLARRHEVHVLTSGVGGQPEIEKHASLDLTVHRARVLGRSDRATASMPSMAAFLPAGIRKGNQLLNSMRFDVVNTWFAIPSGIVGVRIAAKHKVPHVLTIIGGDIYDPSKWYSPHHFWPAGRGVRYVLRHSDSFLAISSDIVSRARQHFQLEEPVEVIPLGITEPDVEPATRESLGLSDNKKYLVAVGRLVRRKDYPTLIRAFSDLGRDDVDLIILGDGPEKDNLASIADSHGVGDQVHLEGFVSDERKYQVLANSDIFTLVSLHEGFGIVYLEAMYFGLPIIAADEGGQVDILSNKETGALLPIGDSKRLTECLSELLDNDDRRREIAKSNSARFHDYSISNLAKRYESAFKRSIEQYANN